MSSTFDRNYLLARLAAERAAAEAAASDSARAAHLRLASEYEQLLARVAKDGAVES